MQDSFKERRTEFLDCKYGLDNIKAEVTSSYIEKQDLYSMNIKFEYKGINVIFPCRADYRVCYIVSAIAQSIEEHGDKWNEHFYYKKPHLYKDGEIVEF